MWLDEITLKDFRCFHGEHTIEFSMDPDENVTLIHAENGVGKTTLLNAMLWCFYGTTTAKFERKQDLVNHDAKAAGRDSCYVEVLFEHNDKRYRARRFHGNGTMGGREFSIMRIDDGHSVSIDNPDSFINTVIPKTMAGHFLFDGEHAEVFLGEERLVALLQPDVALARGSACTSGIPEPSHVLRAMGLDANEAAEVVRLSTAPTTCKSEIAMALQCIAEAAGRMKVIA